MTVVTGPGGSGKSSLAFDTLFAEGQRRFVESQSTYARQFLQRLDKPDVDVIEGLRPTVAVQSRNSHKSSRSTVGTVTEIYDYLRLIYAKIGDLHCPECGKPVRAATIDEMTAEAVTHLDGAKGMVLAPLQVVSAPSFEAAIEGVRARGYSYAIIGGAIHALDSDTLPQPAGDGEIYVVIDRLAFSKTRRARIADSIESALKEGMGECVIADASGAPLKRFSMVSRCLDCGVSVSRPTPQHLSFNSALGACPECKGFGDTYDIDLDLVIPDRSKTLRGGAIECWETPGIRRYSHKMFAKSAEELGVRPDVPVSQLTEAEFDLLLHGRGELYGIYQFFDEVKAKSYKPSNRFTLMRYRTLRQCHVCGGTRLSREARSVKLRGLDIAELGRMPVSEVADFFRNLKLSPRDAKLVQLPLREISGRTGYLCETGLGYISLWRMSRTLSGGEMQRIHLASYLGSRLTGTMYVLDEPTVGLHPRDTDRLVSVLRDLRDLGNTIVVVEHDLQVIRQADHIIDMGPGSGAAGGSVVYEGDAKRFETAPPTLTSDYMAGRKKVFGRRRDAMSAGDEWFGIKGACENNLKNIDAMFPAGRFTCVTGVSGSGKSTLVCDILYPAVARRTGAEAVRCGSFRAATGLEAFDFAELMGQETIARNPRANPMTFLELFGAVRTIFANTQDARRMGLGPGAFSFNSAEGRCPKCEGAGWISIDMQFLADINVKCDECDGSRYKPHIHHVRHNGKTIVEVLEMTPGEAMQFFSDRRSIVSKLATLDEVGLGYLRLGQPVSTLSSGEAQRLKIAHELNSTARGRGLFVFDEPTMGLHIDEVSRFLRSVDRLLAAGHTVVVIEHNLDVIAQADHIIDLGPDGGSAGGMIVAQGTVEDVTGCADSVTGRFLRDMVMVCRDDLA